MKSAQELRNKWHRAAYLTDTYISDNFMDVSSAPIVFPLTDCGWTGDCCIIAEFSAFAGATNVEAADVD